MKNSMIIESNRAALIEAGVIAANEAIHTFMEWKRDGYIVKKGQKAVASFPIWMFTDKPNKEDREAAAAAGEEAAADPHYYMKKAAFFSASQVEKIENKTA